MKYISYAANIIHKTNSAMIFISLASLLLMVFFVAADVIGRYLFDKPILGGMEIQELMMVLIVFLALGVVTRDKGHVYVELLTQGFKGRPLATVKSISCLLSFCFVVLLVWQTVKSGLHELTSATGDFTPMLKIPIAPFILLAAIGMVLMALEFFIDMVINIRNSSIKKSPMKAQAPLNTPTISKTGTTQVG